MERRRFIQVQFSFCKSTLKTVSFYLKWNDVILILTVEKKLEFRISNRRISISISISIFHHIVPPISTLNFWLWHSQNQNRMLKISNVQIFAHLYTFIKRAVNISLRRSLCNPVQYWANVCSFFMILLRTVNSQWTNMFPLAFLSFPPN